MRGKKLEYRGWLIVQVDANTFLGFSPENIDCPESGYEDWEAPSLATAKKWIDVVVASGAEAVE